jgi:hypothetical protein
MPAPPQREKAGRVTGAGSLMRLLFLQKKNLRLPYKGSIFFSFLKTIFIPLSAKETVKLSIYCGLYAEKCFQNHEEKTKRFTKNPVFHHFCRLTSLFPMRY